MMMVACSRIQSLRLRLHACLYLPACPSCPSLSHSFPPGQCNIQSFRAISSTQMPEAGTEKIVVYHHPIHRHGLLLLRRSVVCLRLDASHRHGRRGAAHARPRTRPPPAALVRRAGSRPGNPGAAFAAVFTCDGQLL
jgi:hypothetical protein